MNAVASHNIKFISHSDQGGRGDGVQVMVHKGFAYIGHGFSNGITIIDVRDPKNPKPVEFIACPPNTRAHHLQTHGDLLLGGQRAERMDHAGQPRSPTSRVRRATRCRPEIHQRACASTIMSKPEAPREIAFLPLGGLGRIASGMSAAATPMSRCICRNSPTTSWSIVDMAEPTKPQVVGKFWLPGMWTAGGETPTWPKGRRYALHHGLVAGNLAYSGVARRRPRHRRCRAIRRSRSSSAIAIGIRRSAAARIRRCRCRTAICWSWPTRPISPIAVSGCATSGCSTCACRQIRSASRPCPIPDEADYCKKGGNFGPHNLWENRPGAFVSSRYIFATLHNAGVRVYDIDNPFQPREVAYFVPPIPSACSIRARTGRKSSSRATVSSTRRA